MMEPIILKRRSCDGLRASDALSEAVMLCQTANQTAAGFD